MSLIQYRHHAPRAMFKCRRHMPCASPQCSRHTPCAVAVCAINCLLSGRMARIKSVLIGISIVFCLVSPAFAQETPPPPQLNPWGKFEPGAWKLVRVVTESFSEQGSLASTNTSDYKTTLLDTDDDGVTLEMKVCVEVAGKRFDGEPQTIKQNYYGEQQSPGLKIKEPAAGQVTIEERKIPCQIREIESSNQNGKTSTTIYYSTTAPPYVLKRESVTTDLEGKNITSETNVSVQALEMPCKVMGAMRNAAYVKTLQKTPKGTIYTLAVICPEIPGGIVSNSSKELDSSGRLVRRSTMELVDYNTEPEKSRTGVFGRKRQSRNRGN
jgi:hypothetical protein